MRAGDLISDEIPTLKGSDNILFAMQLLDEYKMRQLPVVENNVFLGLLSDEATLETENYDTPLSEQIGLLQQVFIDKDQHVYDVIKLAAEFQLSAIPILDSKLKYYGVVSIYCLVRELSNLVAMKEEGSVLVLEINQNDYSLSQIAQIVEGNDAKILSANVTSTPDSANIDVTLKINRLNIDHIIQTFERYDYRINASFHQSSYEDLLQDRYEELMRYLKI